MLCLNEVLCHESACLLLVLKVGWLDATPSKNRIWLMGNSLRIHAIMLQGDIRRTVKKLQKLKNGRFVLKKKQSQMGWTGNALAKAEVLSKYSQRDCSWRKILNVNYFCAESVLRGKGSSQVHSSTLCLDGNINLRKQNQTWKLGFTTMFPTIRIVFFFFILELMPMDEQMKGRHQWNSKVGTIGSPGKWSWGLTVFHVHRTARAVKKIP